MDTLEKIALSFSGTMQNLDFIQSIDCEFHQHHNYHLGARLELGFSNIVGIFNAVVDGARAIMDIQRTVQSIGTKFQLLSGQLHELASIIQADPRQVPIKLIGIIDTFQSKDNEKLRQDLYIKQQVDEMNLFMDGVMGRLCQSGLKIV
jgi:hypothetical protein